MRNAIQIHKARESGANQIVAKNVKAELGYAGQNQGDLADILGVSKMAISRRLSSQTDFTANEIQIIADHLGVTPGDLFTPRNRPDNKKAPTPKSEGSQLPELDSNQQPAGSQLGNVYTLPIAPTNHQIEHANPAPIIKLFG